MASTTARPAVPTPTATSPALWALGVTSPAVSAFIATRAEDGTGIPAASS